MASGARKKGKEQEEMKKTMKDVERAMNDIMINYSENVKAQETHEDQLHAHFMVGSNLIGNLPEGPQKRMLQKELEGLQSAASDSKVDMEKQSLMRTMDDIKRKSFYEGDQRPLTGREALNLQNQWEMGMDYSPQTPSRSG